MCFLILKIIVLFCFNLLGDCGKKGVVDIVILMDFSGSVGEENFELMKEFIKSIVDEFVIGLNVV